MLARFGITSTDLFFARRNRDPQRPRKLGTLRCPHLQTTAFAFTRTLLRLIVCHCERRRRILTVMSEKAELIVEDRKIQVSHLDKVLYPKVGFTKGQVIDYYIRIAPVLLPHLKDRPLTMKRYPDGVEGEFFYEKNCPVHRPKWVKTARVWSESNNRMMNYCLAQDLPTLVWAANLADLELHTSLARKNNIKRPTMMVFDLDPGAPADIVQCCQVGIWLSDLLLKMKLKSFAKTSGSKGLQVYVPLNASVTFDQTQDFSRVLAQHLDTNHDPLLTSNMSNATP